MKSTDSQLLPLLPDNVVYEIFKFFSLPERKNARLVCKQWYQIGIRRRFADYEAFFISNMYEIHTAVEVLVKCQRKMLNLKFDCRIFDESSNILWSRCGLRIQSLQFNSCNFPGDIVERIFVDCENLNEFSCNFYDEYLPQKESILQIGDDLVRPKLRILHLNSSPLALRECDLRLISSVFPELNNLSIYLLLSEEKVIRNSDNFTILVNLLNSGLKNLEKLCVLFPCGSLSEPINFSSLPQFNCDRLKNVSMSLEPFTLRGDNFNKILHYKFWRSFKIDWFHTFDLVDMTDITRLLNENPLLEKLDICINFSTSVAFSDFFKALVKSRLKSLRIQVEDGHISLEEAKLFIAAVTPSFEGLPYNNTVNDLFIMSIRSVEFNSLFLQYFRNVLYLEVVPGNVNTVFKYQKNVKSLKIWPLAIRTDELPVHRSIESLELMEIRPLKLDIFTSYQFPNLKYLIITELAVYRQIMRRLDREASTGSANLNINEENDDNATNHEVHDDSKEEFIRKINNLLLSTFQTSPHLEGIKFACDYLLDVESFTILFQSCLYFHQLRYVIFENYSSNVDEKALKREVAKYFKKCPSFRGLWLNISPYNFSFYFNTVSKKYEFSRYTTRNIKLHEFWRYKR